jgi:hypothetical protein
MTSAVTIAYHQNKIYDLTSVYTGRDDYMYTHEQRPWVVTDDDLPALVLNWQKTIRFLEEQLCISISHTDG